MNNKITFKQWLSVFFGGIWQFVCNIFSWDNKAPFWRVVWAIITVCCVVFTSMLGYAFYDEFIRDKSWDYYESPYDSKISENFKFRNNGRNKGKSFIYDTRTKKIILKDIDWIAIPESGDSLIIVSKNGKRGFVNRFTAETVIPFKYDAAWSFSDGVAAVCEDDSVYFINHSGNPINNKKFFRKQGYDNYAYHANYAAIPYGSKVGLIDRTGNWVQQPEYDDIVIGNRNMWYVQSRDKWGVIDVKGQFVFLPQYEFIIIHPINGITVSKDDHSRSRLDYDGTLIDSFVFDEADELIYFTKEFDEDGIRKKAVDNMMRYSTGDFYGLMTLEGKPITPPLYSWIEAVAPGIYQCRIPETYESILINSKGEKVNN